jgi:diguanylate cyclase (GGDEF)-like protein
MSSTHPYSRGPRSRRVLIVPALIVIGMAAMPWIGGWAGRVGHADREILGEVLGSAVILLLGGWILRLIRREQVYTQRHLKDLERLTLTDPLTGLANRRALEHDLQLALRRSERLQEPLASSAWTSDHFSAIITAHGVGDGRCARRRSAPLVLTQRHRRGVWVSGDEFVVVAVADQVGADMLAKRLERDFRERSPRHSELSLGVTVWDGRAGVQELLSQADQQMYRAKGAASRRFA